VDLRERSLFIHRAVAIVQPHAARHAVGKANRQSAAHELTHSRRRHARPAAAAVAAGTAAAARRPALRQLGRRAPATLEASAAAAAGASRLQGLAFIPSPPLALRPLLTTWLLLLLLLLDRFVLGWLLLLLPLAAWAIKHRDGCTHACGQHSKCRCMG
jgi:hypothetical protein